MENNKRSVRSLREIRELLVSQLGGGAARKNEVVETLNQLLGAIEQGNTEHVDSALTQLGVERNDELHGKIGHLTRSLHNALGELRQHLQAQHYSLDSTNIPEATDRLEAIIEMAFKAGEQSFVYMDHQTETLRQIKQSLDSLEDSLEQDAMPGAGDLRFFIDNQRTLLQDLAQTTLNILVAQEYQDVAAQVLKRVIRLLNDLERQLLNLLSLFRLNEDPASDELPERVDQDTANSMLKKMGF